ncbi:hypothetical protein COLO4_16660 [Corchorus olitorius]|uniref:RNase H type-1 domain-containing protein n=1 Tax=Corchorus olitorius TaxID=93759 RepID=A0A1R3JG68_9ROSI|nr:hypothetical protein COLO4_16660 [Corchorus olitorius]
MGHMAKHCGELGSTGSRDYTFGPWMKAAPENAGILTRVWLKSQSGGILELNEDEEREFRERAKKSSKVAREQHGDYSCGKRVEESEGVGQARAQNDVSNTKARSFERVIQDSGVPGIENAGVVSSGNLVSTNLDKRISVAHVDNQLIPADMGRASAKCPLSDISNSSIPFQTNTTQKSPKNFVISLNSLSTSKPSSPSKSTPTLTLNSPPSSGPSFSSSKEAVSSDNYLEYDKENLEPGNSCVNSLYASVSKYEQGVIPSSSSSEATLVTDQPVPTVEKVESAVLYQVEIGLSSFFRNLNLKRRLEDALLHNQFNSKKMWVESESGFTMKYISNESSVDVEMVAPKDTEVISSDQTNRVFVSRRMRNRADPAGNSRFKEVQFWHLVQRRMEDQNIPWLCVGDFNDILYLHEKECGNTKEFWKIRNFKDMILKAYCEASGQLVNLQKSSIIFRNNTPSVVRNQVETSLPIIWKARCAACFEKKGLCAEQVIFRAEKAALEFQKAKEYRSVAAKALKKENDLTIWKKPTVGSLKINCDGAFDEATGEAAFGVIVRDCNGRIIDGIAKLLLVSSSVEAEAIAIKEALTLA